VQVRAKTWIILSVLEVPICSSGFFATSTWQQLHGKEGGSTDLDDEWARRGMENVGAWILGRNMFGPIRGPWPDEAWKGGGAIRRAITSQSLF
jgi:dihydrofolate reductase